MLFRSTVTILRKEYYKGAIIINSGKVSADKNFYAGSEGTITLGFASNDSYIRTGGYDAGKVQVVSGQVLIVSGDSTAKLHSGDLTPGTHDITLNSSAVKGEYTIARIDTGVLNPRAYSTQALPLKPQNPSRKGYTFNGWTGTRLDGVRKIVGIMTGSTGNREYTAVWQENFKPTDENKPEISQHSMILGSQIKVMFYSYIPSSDTPADYTMAFEVSGDKTENSNPIGYTESIDAGGYTLYGYPCCVNSVQMADTIHAKLCDKDGNVIASEDYTAKTYLDRVIASKDVFSSATVNLCKAIKDYGYCV